MPPPGTNAQTDPNVVEGPWKHRPPAQFAENGNPPVARKKARPVIASQGENSTKTKSVTSKDVTNAPHLHAAPINQSLEASMGGSSDSCSCSSMPKVVNTETSSESDKDKEPEEEGDITELCRMKKKWGAPVYVFFKLSACIEYIEGRKVHVFE
ncbi:hypothetical protein V8E53_002634 [Lactarius tabidus]